MAEIQTIIGSLPVCRGEYDAEVSYFRDNQVTMYGSTFQSIADDNVGYPPAEERVDGKVYAINTDKWIIVANALAAYNAGKRIDDLAENTEIKDEEGAVVATPFRYIQNEEFIFAKVDANDKFLYGIQWDGTPKFGKTSVIEDRLQSQVNLLAEKVATIMGDEDTTNVIDTMNELKKFFAEIENTETLTGILANLDNVAKSLDKTTIKDEAGEIQDTPFRIIENPEYLAVEKDEEGKVLSSTNADGSHYIHNAKSETIPTEFSHIEDPEGRMEITKDAKDKIIDYRDSEGFMHFVKLFVRELRIGKELCIKDINDLYDIFKVFLHENKSALNYKFELPVHGDVDILEETFYLTSNSGYTDKEGILPMMVYENTEENAEKGITVSKFYVKSTLTDNNDGTYEINSSSVALDFYVPKDILEKDGKTYVKSTLQKNEDGYTVTDESIEVTKITMPPVLETWKVDKKTEHQCEVKISFGNYLSGVFNVGIKFQGSSTLYRLKRNLRFTFYNSAFSKKEKKKIGELPESNGYNLKAYYADYSRIKEPVIFRLYREARLLHSFNEQAPWNSEQHFYTGNTGCYINFPVTVKIDGKFHNLMFWGTKKEGSNYMLSSDEDGMIVSGAAGGNNWQEYYNQWEDEMNDSLTESNVTALKEFSAFLADENGLSKESLSERIYVNDFIDYYIFITVFRMRDNDIHNVILYSGKDKKKFSCFLYDCDLSINVYYENMESSLSYNKSIWKILRKFYWKEICDRYYRLREKVLNVKNITSIVMDLQKGVPFSDLENEKNKWNLKGQTSSEIVERIEYLFNKYDEYFINN